MNNSSLQFYGFAGFFTTYIGGQRIFIALDLAKRKPSENCDIRIWEWPFFCPANGALEKPLHHMPAKRVCYFVSRQVRQVSKLRVSCCGNGLSLLSQTFGAFLILNSIVQMVRKILRILCYFPCRLNWNIKDKQDRLFKLQFLGRWLTFLFVFIEVYFGSRVLYERQSRAVLTTSICDLTGWSALITAFYQDYELRYGSKDRLCYVSFHLL